MKWTRKKEYTSCYYILWLTSMTNEIWLKSIIKFDMRTSWSKQQHSKNIEHERNSPTERVNWFFFLNKVYYEWKTTKVTRNESSCKCLISIKQQECVWSIDEKKFQFSCEWNILVELDIKKGKKHLRIKKELNARDSECIVAKWWW